MSRAGAMAYTPTTFALRTGLPPPAPAATLPRLRVFGLGRRKERQEGQEQQQKESQPGQGAGASRSRGTLRIIILVKGIALAASGFLPEEYDTFSVKYLYRSFTPTVILFLGGTVGYGVLKYFESEKSKS